MISVVINLVILIIMVLMNSIFIYKQYKSRKDKRKPQFDINTVYGK